MGECERPGRIAVTFLEAELIAAKDCAGKGCKPCRQEAFVLTAVVQAYKDLQAFATVISKAHAREQRESRTD